MYQPQTGGKASAELLMIAGIVVQYVGTRIALAVCGTPDGSTPGRRALAQWLPLMATALAAVVMGHPTVAVCLVLGSSIGCLSLVLGMSMYVGPLRELPASRRVWMLVLPAALLVLLAGFHGSLTWFHAVLLLVLGAAFLPLWLERLAVEPLAASRTNPGPSPDAPISPLWLIPAIALASFGAWAAVRGTMNTAAHSRFITSDLLAATIVSPLLLLPSLGSATMLAQRGRTGQSITALAGTVLLNLCASLPAIILLNYLLGAFSHSSAASSLAGAFHDGAKPSPFPLVTWRIDSVLLVLLGFTLAPLAAGRWLPERIESMLFIFLYAAYLLAETAVSVRLLA